MSLRGADWERDNALRRVACFGEPTDGDLAYYDGVLSNAGRVARVVLHDEDVSTVASDEIGPERILSRW